MDGLVLLAEAKAAGLQVWAEGTKLIIRGPRSSEGTARRLLAHKAAVLSALVLPQEARAVVSWAAWLVECVPQEESDLGKYVTRILSSLALLQSWEAACPPDMRPGWRQERIRELCDTLRALREAVEPFGLSQITEGQTS